ncbi:MAG: hypothetical protein QOG45_2438 [Chloroflexota bacterium]|nr:hypothetical protein [Chloroflexota bacterium]
MAAEIAAPAPVSRYTRTREAAAGLGALVLLLGLAVVLFLPAWGDPAHRVIGGHGDAEQSMWFLRWLPWSLAHGHDPLLTDHIGHPGGVNLMWNSFQPFTALVAAPVTAAAGPVVAYNAMVTLALGLSGWCAYLAIRRLVPGRAAALAGGLLYGFSPYMLAHAVGHLDLVMAPTPPLLLMLLHEVVVRRRWSPLLAGAAIGLLAAAQLFVAEEVLATEAIAALAVLGVLAVLHRDRIGDTLPRLLVALGTGAAVFAALADWALAVQFLGSSRLRGVDASPGVYETDLLNLVIPGDSQRLAPDRALAIARHFTGNGSEQTGYLGVPLLALLAITVVRHRRETLVRVAAAAGAVLVLLSMGPTLHVGGHHLHLPLPGLVLAHLPVLENLLPGRIMLYAFLAAAVLLAVFLSDLRWRAPARRTLAAAALLTAVAATLFPRTPFPSAPVSTPAFFTGAAVHQIPEGDVVLVAPFSRLPVPTDAMVWQALSDMRFRMPEGYYQGPGPQRTRLYGPAPSATSALMERIWAEGSAPPLDPTLRRRIAADLRAWGVRDVVVGPMGHQELMTAVMTSLLGRPPRTWGDVQLWTGVDPAQVVPDSQLAR